MILRCINLIDKYFADKVDKGGCPYKQHLLYVMNHVETSDEKIVGLLHDILEDTDMTKEKLLDYGISKELVDTICILTKNNNEKYEDYIERIINSNNQIAINVKCTDLEHNMDLSRLKLITSKDLVRKSKYKKAYDKLIQYKKQM